MIRHISTNICVFLCQTLYGTLFALFFAVVQKMDFFGANLDKCTLYLLQIKKIVPELHFLMVLFENNQVSYFRTKATIKGKF